ncbi:transmembrane protein 43 homolog [Sabethes cyaneus]|uniref:transmembrane protein 43 homolog n=1 Tax=Sabethes cyaneus TaxID=53552 RepID=UPI00237E29A5|nr:transmembrane protein 43 homolog [Sabethes cyaneus]XP_053688088.1 transmembrane protein 43 homolog [Sabethes cyaneus]
MFGVLKTCWLRVLLALASAIAGSSLLMWNETKAIGRALSLEEALNGAITVDDNIPYVEAYEGKVIHLKGLLVTGEPLTEPDYNIEVQAVKLRRHVEMYQWKEEYVENHFGNSDPNSQSDDRSYYYTRDWWDDLIDSRSFYIRSGHHNPTTFPLESKTYVSDRVHIGQYELDDALKERFNNFVGVSSDTRPKNSTIKVHGGFYYHCHDLLYPAVGDIRVWFSYAGLEDSAYTVVGKLENGRITSYKSSYSENILLLYPGEISLHNVFKLQNRSEQVTAWGHRLVGWILLYFATFFATSALRRISGQSIPNVSVSTYLVVSLSQGMMIIALVYTAYRPMLSFVLLLVSSVLFFGWFKTHPISHQNLRRD